MRILLTAFEPYDDWQENSSWLALVELLKDRPQAIDLVTRRYPSSLAPMQTMLRKDLENGFDAILHIGQMPGITGLRLEVVALNIVGRAGDMGSELQPLIKSGPLAFKSMLPMGRWCELLRSHSIPAEVSYHAGTCLCNALFYLTQYAMQAHDQRTPVGFIHVPLTTMQAARARRPLPSLDVAVLVSALRLIVGDLPNPPPAD